MIEEQKVGGRSGGDDGRTVYSRLGAEGGEGRAGGPDDSGHEAPKPARARAKVATPLSPLLVGFALLVGLVIVLGQFSAERVEDVSQVALEQERQLAGRYRVLLVLQVALNRLDSEARARARVEGNRGLLPPLNVPLRTARAEADAALAEFNHLPLAQADAGRAFGQDVAAYLAITEDLGRYSLEGFAAFREVEERLNRFVEEARREQQEIPLLIDESKRRARSRINWLTTLAVLVGTLVAAGTIWEVQRRSRQIRRGLDELRRERQFSHQMLEGMVSAIAAIDRRDRVRSANAAFRRLFPEIKPGASVHDKLAAPEAMRVLAAATATRVTRSTYRGRHRLPAGAGDGGHDARSFDVYSSPLEIDGAPGQLVTLVDVTEAAKSERELRQREALAAVGQAAAQVAHEIKNPLGSIRLGVAMLRDMTDSAEAHSTIDLVERGIEHLNKLTQDVTQFSRRKELQLAEVPLHELLDASLELVADKVAERRARVERRLSAEPLRVEADPDQLRQVFVNLFANALDASPEGAPLTIHTSRVALRRTDGATAAGGDGVSEQQPSTFARVAVADRGAGMDAKTLARVFEPFFTTKKRGTGLGLAIARQIVEQHGGRIAVESTPGEGTRFTVDLPLRQ